jgi:hypothetical protein
VWVLSSSHLRRTSHQAIKRVYYFLYACSLKMKVDARGLDIGVSEQLLDNKNIRARLQKVGGKTMAKRMYRYMLGDPAFFFALENTVCIVRSDSGFSGLRPGKSHGCGRYIFQYARSPSRSVIASSV